jgi:Glycosyltransferase 61
MLRCRSEGARNKGACIILGFLVAHAVVPALIRPAQLRELVSSDSSGHNHFTTMKQAHVVVVEKNSYSIDRFKEMNGKPATFSLRDFRFTSLVVEDGELQENVILTYNEAIALSQTPSAVCQVFCRVPVNSFGMDHFPHFLQQAYPCWALWQRFRGGNQKNYMILPEERDSKYIRSFLDAIKHSGLQVSILQGDERLPLDSEWCSSNDAISILAERTFKDSRWDGPVRWFMNYTEDVEQLQMAVLGSDFRAGPSSLIPHINILILDRKKASRDWAFASDATKLLGLELGKLVKVTHLKSFNGMSLHAQARAMHSADIIVSPHGAQLSNLAYIRPCTVVVELFPRGYYLQFFQSLVISAGGLSYEGYPTGGDRYEDTLPALVNATVRGRARSASIPASPSSLIDALPELLHAASQCRSQFD